MEINLNISEAHQLILQNKLPEALRLLDECILSDGVDIHAINLRGRVHYRMQSWGAAMNDYASVLELDPENAEAKSGLEMARNILGYFTPDMFNP